jgi:predicted AAA+ superfamily ATPase
MGLVEKCRKIRDQSHLQVITTGPSSFELSGQVSEPLTGRRIVYQLYPLTFEELAAGRLSNFHFSSFCNVRRARLDFLKLFSYLCN